MLLLLQVAAVHMIIVASCHVHEPTGMMNAALTTCTIPFMTLMCSVISLTQNMVSSSASKYNLESHCT